VSISFFAPSTPSVLGTKILPFKATLEKPVLLWLAYPSAKNGLIVGASNIIENQWRFFLNFGINWIDFPILE
jgi:hypothetical protein